MKILSIGAVAVAALTAAGVIGLRAGETPDARLSAASSAGPSAEALRIRRAIQSDAVAPALAPRDHDITIVFFSDYQCPYCRKMHVAIEALVREDPKVKVLYRDWPIFGAASLEAARAAIAAQYQGKHTAINQALMQSPGRLNSESIRAAAARAGVNWARLQTDQTARRAEIDAVLGRNSRYAAMMGLTGTPGAMVGPYLIPGAVDLPTLRRTVAMARQANAPRAGGAT